MNRGVGLTTGGVNSVTNAATTGLNGTVNSVTNVAGKGLDKVPAGVGKPVKHITDNLGKTTTGAVDNLYDTVGYATKVRPAPCLGQMAVKLFNVNDSCDRAPRALFPKPQTPLARATSKVQPAVSVPASETQSVALARCVSPYSILFSFPNLSRVLSADVPCVGAQQHPRRRGRRSGAHCRGPTR